MTLQRDAYTVLQVDPRALPEVIVAAYRALARLHHPDMSPSPEAARRMAELNQAFAAVRTPDRRRAYDQLRAGNSVGSFSETSNGHAGAAASPPSPAATPAAAPHDRRIDDVPSIDFGRYQGWSLRDIARQDPDYLRWLSRHSSGTRYRRQIAEELGRRTATAAAR